MAEKTGGFSFFSRKLSPEEEERQELLGQLKGTREQLKMARISFENASEPELVDASVYEINALQARYNYLLRRAREQGCISGNEVFK